MRETSPSPIAPDYTDDELYEWMRQKINGAGSRSGLIAARLSRLKIYIAQRDILNLEKQRH